VNINSVSTQLLFTTAPIWVENMDGSQGSATGCIYLQPFADKTKGGIPMLLTNYHVVKDARRAVVDFAQRQGDLPMSGKRVRIEIPRAFLTAETSEIDDLVAIPIGHALNEADQSPTPIFFRTLTPDIIPSDAEIEKLRAVEEVTFVGYPSGLLDQHNVTPIVRRGITATPIWNDFENKPCFLIDAGVYPGSSGSPVFIVNEGGFATTGGFAVGNRVMFLGMITETIVRIEKEEPRVFLGLGKVLKSSQIRQFAESVSNKFMTAVSDSPKP